MRPPGAALVLPLALLGGCAVGPRFSPPAADTPPAWTSAPTTSGVISAPAAEGAWWTAFGDAELTSLIDRAETLGFDVRQAVLRIDEARAQRRQAAAALWPQITAQAGYTNTRISERTATTSLLSSFGARAAGAAGPPGGVAGAIPGLTNPFDQYQLGLNASWEVDLFGRVSRTVEAADADAEAAVWDDRAVRLSLAAEVASAYLDLRAAQVRRGLAEDSLKTAQGLLKLARDSRAAGLGDDASIAAAAGAADNAEAELPPLERQAAADRNQLTLLLALKPGALDAELDAAKALPPAPPQVPVGLPLDLARRRPDIRAAEAQLHAATARQGVAVASLYPSLTLSAAPGFQASRLSELTDWQARYFSVGPSLSLPLFDGGQRRAEVQIADARAKEAALAYAKTVLSALDEVENAISAHLQEQARQAELKAAADQSGQALELARRKYMAGSANFRDVLTAEDKLEQAQTALTASLAADDADLVALYKALGGGWQS